jgi:hypothetical protein
MLALRAGTDRIRMMSRTDASGGSRPKWLGGALIWSSIVLGLLVGLIGPATQALGAELQIPAEDAVDGSERPDLSQVRLPDSFASVNEIKDFLLRSKLPNRQQEVQSKTNTFYFISGYPYSGWDSANLYCYVRTEGEWDLFLRAVLVHCPPPMDISCAMDGEYVNIEVIDKESKRAGKPARDRETLLRLNPPKVSNLKTRVSTIGTNSPVFRTTDQIRDFLNRSETPFELKEVKAKNHECCFVVSWRSPASSEADLYFYIWSRNVWARVFRAVLWNTPRTSKVECKVQGEMVDVISDGRIFLSVKPRL